MPTATAVTGDGREIIRAIQPCFLPAASAAAGAALGFLLATMTAPASAATPRPSRSPYLGVRWPTWLRPPARIATRMITPSTAVMMIAPAR
jgi:hypothetical protein